MPLGSIGAVLLVLVAVLLFSRGWFHFVEGILSAIKRFLNRKAPLPAWHTLAAEPKLAQSTDGAQHRLESAGQETGFAQVYNYIVVDNINGKPATDFWLEHSTKRKGIFAPKVEIIFLKPGYYEITAHGKTYQTNPAVVEADLDAGKYYCLGAAEDGLYIEERPCEWTL